MTIDEILAQPNGSIESIGVCLDGIPFSEKADAFTKLLAKVSKNGSITISGLDVHSFAKSITNSTRSLDEINTIIQNCKSLDSLDNIKRFLLQHNFKTESCKRDNGYYICTARHQL